MYLLYSSALHKQENYDSSTNTFAGGGVSITILLPSHLLGGTWNERATELCTLRFLLNLAYFCKLAETVAFVLAKIVWQKRNTAEAAAECVIWSSRLLWTPVHALRCWLGAPAGVKRRGKKHPQHRSFHSIILPVFSKVSCVRRTIFFWDPVGSRGVYLTSTSGQNFRGEIESAWYIAIQFVWSKHWSTPPTAWVLSSIGSWALQSFNQPKLQQFVSLTRKKIANTFLGSKKGNLSVVRTTFLTCTRFLSEKPDYYEYY